MTRVAEPAARTNPLPTIRADRYEATLTGLSGVLVDYAVEATDATGRVATSDLQHVWIGTGTATGGGGGGGRGTVSWTPTAPAREQTVTVKVAAPGTGTARLHWGVNPQGSTWATPIAAYRPAGTALFGANGPAVETPFTREGDTLRATLGPFTDAAQAVSALAFVVHYGDDTWDNNGGTDYRIAVSGSTGGGGAAFVLDGRLDAGVAVAAQSGGRTLHAAYRGGMLYLATEGTASAGDAFVLVAETPGAPMAAMWGKGGTVATPRAFLARESTNGYAAWFTPPASGATTSAAYRMASGEMVEGTVDVAAAFGRIPDAVYVAAAEYATADGGALRVQAPAGNGDASLDAAEFVRIALTTTTAADGADASTGAFALGPLAPNPLVGEGRLPLRLARAGRVTVEAFDVLGRRVATLLDRDEPAGAVLVAVPAGTLAPGVYIVRASQHGETRTARIVVR